MIVIEVFNPRFGKEKLIEFTNDCSIMVMLYHVLLFTDYLYSNKMRYLVGFSLTGFTLLILAPQLIYLIFNLLQSIIFGLKVSYFRKYPKKLKIGPLNRSEPYQMKLFPPEQADKKP
jgi:hypothetical protein